MFNVPPAASVKFPVPEITFVADCVTTPLTVIVAGLFTVPVCAPDKLRKPEDNTFAAPVQVMLFVKLKPPLALHVNVPVNEVGRPSPVTDAADAA